MKKWTVKRLVAVGMLLSVVIAGGISIFASSHPDGLERVAIDSGFSDDAKANANSDSLFADYSFSLFGDSALGGSIAGIIGIAVTALAAWGLFAWLRPKGEDEDGDDNA